MMRDRVISRWNRWKKCHSYDWVNHNWKDYCVVDGEKPGFQRRGETCWKERRNCFFVYQGCPLISTMLTTPWLGQCLASVTCRAAVMRRLPQRAADWSGTSSLTAMLTGGRSVTRALVALSRRPSTHDRPPTNQPRSFITNYHVVSVDTK